MNLVLQDFLDKQKEYDKRLAKLDDEISRMDALKKSLREENRKLKAAERNIADLKAKLKSVKKNRYGNDPEK